MMFDLSTDEKQLRARISNILKELPRNNQLSGEQLSGDMFIEARNRGLLREQSPADKGFSAVLIAEELAASDAGLSLIFANNYLCERAAGLSSNKELQKKVETYLVDGIRPLDMVFLWPQSKESRSEIDWNKIRVEGALAIGSGSAKWCLTAASVKRSAGHKESALILIERAGKEVEIEAMPTRSIRTDQMTFSRLKINKTLAPRDLICLFHDSAIFETAINKLACERTLIFGASMLGLARAAFEYALNYSSERNTFGKPLIQHQAIALKLAEMATAIEAARLVLWEASSSEVANSEQAGDVWNYCKDVAINIGVESVQVLAGHGYIEDHPLEKYVRDMNLLRMAH